MNTRIHNPSRFLPVVTYIVPSDGSQQIPFRWWLRRVEDISVQKNGTVLKYGTDYIINDAFLQTNQGGAVELIAPTVAGDKIVLAVDHLIEDVVFFVPQGEIRADTLNLQHRYFVQLFKELRSHTSDSTTDITRKLLRTVQLSPIDPDPAVPVTIPSYADRTSTGLSAISATTIAGFDRAGNIIAINKATIGGGGGVTPPPVDLSIFNWVEASHSQTLTKDHPNMYVINSTDDFVLELPPTSSLPDGFQFHVRNEASNFFPVTIMASLSADPNDSCPVRVYHNILGYATVHSLKLEPRESIVLILDKHTNVWRTNNSCETRSVSILRSEMKVINGVVTTLGEASRRNIGTLPKNVPEIKSDGKLDPSILPMGADIDRPIRIARFNESDTCAQTLGVNNINLITSTNQFINYLHAHNIIVLYKSLYYDPSSKKLSTFQLIPTQIKGKNIKQIINVLNEAWYLVPEGDTKVIYGMGKCIGLGGTYSQTFYYTPQEISFTDNILKVVQCMRPFRLTTQPHIAIVHTNGDVSTCGINHNGERGVGTADTTPTNTFSKANISNVTDLQVVANSSYGGVNFTTGATLYATVVESNVKKVYVWGSGWGYAAFGIVPNGVPTEIPEVRDFDKIYVIPDEASVLYGSSNVKCYLPAVIVVAKGGNGLWVCGNKSYGRLGVTFSVNTGSQADYIVRLTNVTTITNVDRIYTSSSPGMCLTAIVYKDNTVKFMGRNIYGIMGAPSSVTYTYVPQTPTDNPEETTDYQGKVKHVVMSYYMTFIITTEGKVFTAGNNGYGLLCIQDYTSSGFESFTTDANHEFKHMRGSYGNGTIEKVSDLRVPYYGNNYVTVPLPDGKTEPYLIVIYESGKISHMKANDVHIFQPRYID